MYVSYMEVLNKKKISLRWNQNPDGTGGRNMTISDKVNVNWRKKLHTKALRKDMTGVWRKVRKPVLAQWGGAFEITTSIWTQRGNKKSDDEKKLCNPL